MKTVLYTIAAIAVAAAVAVNAMITVNFNVAKIYSEWYERRADYDNCFKAFGLAAKQIEAICDRWGGECFTIKDACAKETQQEVRYSILLYGNPFVNVIRDKNLFLCELEERIILKMASI